MFEAKAQKLSQLFLTAGSLLKTTQCGPLTFPMLLLFADSVRECHARTSGRACLTVWLGVGQKQKESERERDRELAPIFRLL